MTKHDDDQVSCYGWQRDDMLHIGSDVLREDCWEVCLDGGFASLHAGLP